MIIYPVRRDVDAEGRQLVNWLCEFIQPARFPGGDWSRPGQLEDFFWACERMRFDWLDIPAMVKAADVILEYPMVDRDPLGQWSFGRLTLLGDAAHPMYPRGSNGAGQAILDARTLAGHLKRLADPVAAFRAYEADRMGPTGQVVLTNRSNPPDAILREVYERTGDKPFRHIDEVIGRAELEALSDAYKRIAGFQRESLSRRGSLV
jgi:2-polyprenyl-6-methoxyphenol hydroxylase-like FAD-dependent oxidoreductase